MKYARSFILATLVAVALGGTTLSGLKAAPASPITLSNEGIKVVAKDAAHVNVFAGDREVMTLSGYHVLWKPKAKTVGGKLQQITLPDGRAAIEVNYRLDHDLNGTLRVRGRFIPGRHRLHVRFDVWGVPEKNNLGGSMILRTLGKNVPSREAFKLGRWVRDDNGGVPYEVKDGTLYRYQWNDVSVWLAFPKSNPNWQSSFEKHCPLQQVNADHWKSEFDMLVTDPTWRAKAASALWHHRPLGLSVWTDKDYNWWTSNDKPMQVHAQIVNTSDRAQNVDLAYWARNFTGDMAARDDQQLYLKPGDVVNRTISIKASHPRELLFMEVSANNGTTESFLRTNLAILPPHQFKSTPKDSIFGLSAAWPLPNEDALYRLLERMGVRWMRSGNAKDLAKYGINANHHSNISPHDKYAGKPKARDTWIRKQLELCDKQGNPYWEFGNEWNGSGGWASGSPKAAKLYVEYLKAIHRIKEQIHAKVKILSMGLGGMDVKFMRNVHDAGGWPLFDAFALHAGRGNFVVDYPVKKPWNEWTNGAHGSYWNFLGTVREAKHILEEYGEKPLWITETYALTYPNHWWNDTQRQAAQNVILTYAICAAEGVRCVEFYQLDNGVWYDRGGVNAKNREYYFGLLMRDLSFKPSLMAYCAIAENLDQATFVRWLQFDNPKTKGLLFDTPRGPLAILWNRADGYIEHQKEDYVETEPWVKTWKTKTPVELPATSDTVRVLNAIGIPTILKPDNGHVRLELTGAPKMIYGLAAKKLGK